MNRPPPRRPRPLPVVLLALATSLAACATPPGASPAEAPSSPDPTAVSLRFEIPVVPGPVKPYRGEMSQQVYMVDGLVSMYFELRNVGDEALTFLNTLYDYEPQQLYTPVVRLEWQEGGDAVYTRAGRFFPSPAIIQPGERAVYIMPGQQARGSGTPGELVTHIKYCPTRGMDDQPGIPVDVAGLTWRDAGDGTVEVSGTLVEVNNSQRRRSPTIGVAFFDAFGGFVGAVVENAVGDPLQPGEQRQFTLRGGGVSLGAAVRAEGYAVIP